MNVSVIFKARKKKKSDVDVTSVFLKGKKQKDAAPFLSEDHSSLGTIKKSWCSEKKRYVVQKHLHG